MYTNMLCTKFQICEWHIKADIMIRYYIPSNLSGVKNETNKQRGKSRHKPHQNLFFHQIWIFYMQKITLTEYQVIPLIW